MTVTLECINEYNYSDLKVEVGERIEAEKDSFAYTTEDSKEGLHAFTLEPDEEGISYKTWFKEVSV